MRGNKKGKKKKGSTDKFFMAKLSIKLRLSQQSKMMIQSHFGSHRFKSILYIIQILYTCYICSCCNHTKHLEKLYQSIFSVNRQHMFGYTLGQYKRKFTNLDEFIPFFRVFAALIGMDLGWTPILWFHQDPTNVK